MRAMNAPFVMPIITAASKRSRSIFYPSPEANGTGAGRAGIPAPIVALAHAANPLLRDRELLHERPGAALGLRTRELRQRGVAVRVERPLAEHAVVVLRAGEVGPDCLPVVGLVAGGRDRREDDLGGLIAVD